jgi:hypothetical protein
VAPRSRWEIREDSKATWRLETECQIEGGLPAHEARDVALKPFGNPVRHREDCVPC